MAKESLSNAIGVEFNRYRLTQYLIPGLLKQLNVIIDMGTQRRGEDLYDTSFQPLNSQLK